MAIASSPVYAEVYEFLLSAPTPAQVIAFHASEATQDRVQVLLDANRDRTLTADEEAELDEFQQVNHFVSMLKIYAGQRLNTPT
ncbi:MAG: hypothetical protein K8J31_30965 [Anaerolineae bacterium]|nr:hypothetical protein [Anaerolineae bacterium]